MALDSQTINLEGVRDSAFTKTCRPLFPSAFQASLSLKMIDLTGEGRVRGQFCHCGGGFDLVPACKSKGFGAFF